MFVHNPRKDTFPWRALVFAAIFAVSGCEPRGETITLNEVLERSKADYREAVEQASGKLGQDIKGHLERVVTSVESLIEAEKGNALKNPALTKTSEDVAHLLDELTTAAGYTSRPALGELAIKFRNLSTIMTEGEAVGPEVRLLASQVYTLLASELEAVKFGLKERELK
jgi:hypothetical protein